MEDNNFPKDPAGFFSTRQQLFTRYLTAVLVDLTVLNLFSEYWEYVIINSFMISMLAASLLQVLLKLTIFLEHRIAAFFSAKSGVQAKVLRILSAWAILFASKIIILEAINLAFGDDIIFAGPFHGLVAFIVVVSAILVTELIVKRIYEALA